MAFFIGLVSISITVWLVSRFIKRGPFQKFWSAARLSATIMFLQVGIMHLFKPDALSYMIEGLLPYPKLLVIVSGVTEILLGLGLLFPKTRKWSAWLLIIQLLVIFPANINVAVNQLSAPGGLPSEPWYVWSRLLFQPIYIFWIYRSSLKNAGMQLAAAPAMLLLGLPMLSFAPQATTSSCTVEVRNLPEEGGEVYIGWYKDEEEFREVSKSVFKKIVPVKSESVINVDFNAGLAKLQYT